METVPRTGRLDYRQPAAMTTFHWVAIGVWLLACAVFVLMAFFAKQYPMFPGDLEITRAIQRLRSPVMDTLAGALLWVGLPPQASFIYGGYVVLLAVVRRLWDALMTLLAAVGAGGLYYLVEPMVNQPRPSPDVVYVVGPLQMGSFPSGHAAIILAVYGLFIFLIARGMPPSIFRTALFVLLSALIVGIGLSRVYHGQHWPSDVVAGYLLGAIWLSVVITVHNVGARRWHRRKAATQ
jgi:undecaprenyl-diphosphatase